MDWEQKIKRRSAALIIGLFLGFGGLLFIINSAHAVQLGSPLYIDAQYGFTCDVGGVEIFIFNEDFTENAEGRCNGDLAPTTQPSWYTEITGNLFIITQPGIYTWEVYDITGNITTETFNVTFIEQPVSGNIFGENGLLGTSTLSLMAGVVTGVQDTGANLWPLFVFLGVPLAVVIGFMLIQFIFMSVGASARARKTETIEFDNEKADSLVEFFKRDGGIDSNLKSKIVRGSKNNS